MYMPLPILYSAKRIERQFNTGEQPVLVTCSDVNTYVCKYMRSSAAAYKLVCELIGAKMAKAWQLPLTERLNKEYENSIHRCKLIPIEIIEDIPQEWNVPQTIITDKISQLFDEKWLIGVWNNFTECLNENINHE